MPSGPRRRIAVVRVVVTVVAGAVIGLGCGRQLTREQLESRYVDEIVEAGIDRAIAECVIGRLFGPMSDDELREFNTTGTGLSPAETQRVAELADACEG